ncbi:unnamed protein product [Pieris macdunnoughi]|uniref:Kazal-like domain-containing protein n=1 Tax=Pieris macdunnoughi TaxID=345717 RepID=A0A821MH84_9NEOP|nr:unnamed protein product [Pieris macdunnoughi]
MRLIIACVTILGMARAALAMSPFCTNCKPTSPVCGSDWKTYSSECSLKCENLYNLNPPVVIYNGPCEDLLPKPDPNPYQPCNLLDIYNPCVLMGAHKSH